MLGFVLTHRGSSDERHQSIEAQMAAEGSREDGRNSRSVIKGAIFIS